MFSPKVHQIKITGQNSYHMHNPAMCLTIMNVLNSTKQETAEEYQVYCLTGGCRCDPETVHQGHRLPHEEVKPSKFRHHAKLDGCQTA